MKLYYSSGSCSMSCHIALEESGLQYTAVGVDWEAPDANLAELERLNPLRVVPLLTHEGRTLTQNLAILEYVSDSRPESGLLPKAGTWERAEAMQWLSFVASDLHKSFGPLFDLKSISSSEAAQKDARQWAVGRLNEYLAHFDKNLEGKDHILGKTFTAADAYAFTVLGWAGWVQVSLAPYKNIAAYKSRVYQRPAVQRVLKIHDMLE